ncbi:type IX secretion system membrane protein PorP/SprF [Dokdonia sp. Hel_I_53]|uniref:PorP/SprF family type IX secretion system membrane protein n=1 Tax=Dokdonia sp. Hel_I_53 TaxID=1566287 RepID=UPI00119A42E2|nr:type IX secretion system membrane protein PorP/SprF [Dokdonia sp. Hel_I_53]TVZ52874.1 type IX secretion system PorP/SprF family membrane protein [Dokdonia sp. Hel_I_53]
MKKLQLILVTILITMVMMDTYAQQDPQYTQYMYNTVVINPAYAGNRGVTSIVGLHRSQWVGLDGAPRTQSFSIHSPVGEKNVGLGLSIVNDALGPAQETYFGVDFSYTINTSDNGRLSFGLKGGGHLLDVDLSKLNIADRSDPRFSQNVDNKFSPVIGAGVYYHGEKFYAGISVPNLVETEHFDRSTNDNSSSSFVEQERLHYYGIIGYAFDLTDQLKFKPSAMVKAVTGAPLQVDATANFLLMEKLHMGIAYRWDAAWSGLVGFQVSDSMLIGLTYDRESTDLGNTVYNDGSFEVFLRFELFNEYDRMLTPRFF